MSTGALLEGRRVVLTGSVANIGAATARLFAEHGASLFLLDLDPAVADTAASIAAGGTRVWSRVTDVSAFEDVKAAYAEAAEAMGGIDIIINNAGVQGTATVEEMSEELWNRHFTVNVGSCFLSAKAGISYLKQSDKGVMINMASIAGQRPTPGLAAYAASKAAVINFTKTLAAELAGTGIRVNALCPGFVDTAFNDPAVEYFGGREVLERNVAAGTFLKRQAVPEEMADAFLFLASDQSSYATGLALVIDGGMTA